MSLVEYPPRMKAVAWLILQGFQAAELALLDNSDLLYLTEMTADITGRGMPAPQDGK